jgi:hypothetical protein
MLGNFDQGGLGGSIRMRRHKLSSTATPLVLTKRRVASGLHQPRGLAAIPALIAAAAAFLLARA